MTRAPTFVEGDGWESPKHVRRDIQGLRALAVLLVITNHLFGWPNGGFLGVDVFFVISGYLITGLLVREHARFGRISIKDFYARRARRIFPAAALVLAATVLGSIALSVTTRTATTVIDAAWAAVFAANWRMAATGTDYFQLGLPPSPVQHYWSLAVEEQFYLIWPLILILLLAGTAAAATRRSRAIWVISAIVFASFAWAVIQNVADPTVAYFSTFTRGWELGIGALAAVATGAVFGRTDERVRAIASISGALAIFVSALLVSPRSGVPASVAAVLGTALVLIAGDGCASAFYNRALFPFTNRIANYVGDISYSLYLWHLPVIVLLLAVSPAGSRTYVVASLALIALLSVGSYHLVENPIRFSGWLRRGGPGADELQGSRRWLPTTVLAGVALISVTAIVSGASVVIAARTSDVTAGQQNLGACVGAATMDADSECFRKSPATPLVPSVDIFEKDTGIAFSCYRTKDGALNRCTLGSTRTDALRVALVGDSHAAALLPALEPGLIAANWSLTVFVGYGCQWRDDAASNCGTVMDQIQAELLDAGAPYELVLTTSARWTNGADPSAAAESYARQWAPVVALGTSVVAVADNPGVSEEALQCFTLITYDPRQHTCATARIEALAVVDALPIAVDLVPGSAIVHLTDLFCTEESCPSVIGGVIVYRDTAGHVTATYASTLTSYLFDRLDEAMCATPPGSFRSSDGAFCRPDF